MTCSLGNGFLNGSSKYKFIFVACFRFSTLGEEKRLTSSPRGPIMPTPALNRPISEGHLPASALMAHTFPGPYGPPGSRFVGQSHPTGSTFRLGPFRQVVTMFHLPTWTQHRLGPFRSTTVVTSKRRVHGGCFASTVFRSPTATFTGELAMRDANVSHRMLSSA